MVEYKCPRCNYKTKDKSRYINHLKRKIICENINNVLDLNDEYTLLSTDLWQIPSKEPRHQCIISKDLKSDVHPSLTSGYPLLLKDFDTSLKVSNTMINKDWASDQKSD